MELRCCCNPNLLLGHLPDPSEEDKLGAVIGKRPKVMLPTKDGKTAQVEVGAICLGLFGSSFPAYKSDDRPIDYFRNIVGFVEEKRK